MAAAVGDRHDTGIFVEIRRARNASLAADRFWGSYSSVRVTVQDRPAAVDDKPGSIDQYAYRTPSFNTG